MHRVPDSDHHHALLAVDINRLTDPNGPPTLSASVSVQTRNIAVVLLQLELCSQVSFIESIGLNLTELIWLLDEKETKKRAASCLLTSRVQEACMYQSSRDALSFFSRRELH